MSGFGDRLRRFKPSRKRMMIIAAVLVILAIVLIGIIAWSSIVEGLRSLWHAYTVRREHITPLVPLISNLLTVLVAVVAAWIALARHFAQTRADTQRRITENFSTAVAQLGDDKLEIRLGGIYALERISRESDQDYWPIMEILTAFVREHARWEDEDFDQQTVARLYRAEKPMIPRTDIAAILTVIGRRTPRQWELEPDVFDLRRLNLQSTNLRGAGLAAAQLERANLQGAHLERANLVGAHLEGANLHGAHLERAYLAGAHLQGALLINTMLDEAIVSGANLRGDWLEQWQIDRAIGDGETKLRETKFPGPFPLKRPRHWPNIRDERWRRSWEEQFSPESRNPNPPR
jgi:Pentapeptide repeats (8 copies)